MESIYKTIIKLKGWVALDLDGRYCRKLNESEEEYIYRVCSKKEIIGDWNDVANVLNSELNHEYSESKYRKQFQAFQKMFDANKCKFIEDESYIKEIQKQKDDLYRIKCQVYDQRREYNKLQMFDARFENLTNRLVDVAKHLNKEKPLEFISLNDGYSSNEAVICFSDWHYGMITDNIWNVYNTGICRKRVEQMVIKAKKHILLHKPKVLHVLLLGDSAHGAIHTTCRVASEEDTCDQIMHVAEIIAEAVCELSKGISETKVYSTYGNHLRTIQNKNDSIHSDNMEKIIPWWLEQRFQDQKTISVLYAEYKEFIKLNVLGSNICCTHGDLDKFKDLGVTVNTIFTKKFHETIDYTISADKHHLEEFEQFGIESILVRSLCGVDDYANDHRLYSNAGQTLMIFSEDGRECTYNIKLC